jgi:hypothetical protein
MSILGSISSAEKCTLLSSSSVGFEINLTCIPRKRIEGQIKELGDKSERAKTEVGTNGPRSLPTSLTGNLVSMQIVEIQTAHQALIQQQAGPSSLPAVKA